MNHTLGFIGLGVMGSGMSSNLARKSQRTLVVYDPDETAMTAAVEVGAQARGSVAAVGGEADIVFLSLPSIVQVESVCEELLAGPSRPQIVVDMSTSDVTRTRVLAERLRAEGIALVDAPVARQRQAAAAGTLLITVGADDETFALLQPYLSCMGTDIVQAGDVGAGQVLKIMNNMVLFINMNAVAEALAIGRAAGVNPQTLFSTLALGSADSFALRNTATATMIPDEYPERAFPVDYAMKDLKLALQLAADSEVPIGSAQQTMDLLQRAHDAGLGAAYYPVMIKVIEGRA
ncbi:NAD(P)-dependent oxidoreductase [Gordonia polyisoprenivorans]|uniref:NAD(P)-dependent oxidoreductase n=1 Tax=Gordonia polyisoprenivorans TaxID=84595 RepID=UPI001AD7BC0F|nr:NAD(P)-dependent oxidoreductase [Gordonia polyisoprenivorans]QTI70969.1 NAD(P)-dependent oxidoreductase [Gordonia polyisoprenivorans]